MNPKQNGVELKHKLQNGNPNLGAGFIAPDGGWGWLVVVAAGCSNLSVFPVLQQFGLLFRDKLTSIGLTGSEITTIINLNSCLTSFSGLLNGPMFRTFSYRQVGFCGALLAAIGLFFTSISNSFLTYVVGFSILYGAGTGINSSANALALNTYFKEKRRMATGLSWTVTALGPIIFPHIMAMLIPIYGVQGTVLLFSGIALNGVALALIYQPVHWHTHTRPVDTYEALAANQTKCQYCQSSGEKSQSIISSQYLHNCDNVNFTGYEIIDPGTPMMSLANDGWYSTTPAKRSLYSSKVSLSSNFVSRKASFTNSRKTSYANLGIGPKDKRVYQTDDSGYEDGTNNPSENSETLLKSNRSSYVNLYKEGKREKKLKEISNRLKIEEADAEDCPSFKAPQDLSGSKSNVMVSSESRPISGGLIKVKSDSIIVNENGVPTIRLDPNYSLSTKGPLAKVLKATYTPPPSRKISTNSFNAEREVLKNVCNKLEAFVSTEEFVVCTCHKQREVFSKENLQLDQDDYVDNDDGDTNVEEIEFTFWQKFCIFFDLDLLRDLTYVNLMVGVTIANFAELNYSILTPFVMAEYGLTKAQTATSMSLLGAMDISVRFFVPFIAGKIGWENKTFFLFGVLGMALGRVSIAHFHSYPAIIAASCFIGLNKGLRTVFMALVIPSYIPLTRLPGATGLQLLFAGIFYFVMGPVIGWITDATNYTVTLHCLNIATYLTAIAWGLEKLYHSRRRKKEKTANAVI